MLAKVHNEMADCLQSTYYQILMLNLVQFEQETHEWKTECSASLTLSYSLAEAEIH